MTVRVDENFLGFIPQDLFTKLASSWLTYEDVQVLCFVSRGSKDLVLTDRFLRMQRILEICKEIVRLKLEQGTPSLVLNIDAFKEKQSPTKIPELKKSFFGLFEKVIAQLRGVSYSNLQTLEKSCEKPPSDEVKSCGEKNLTVAVRLDRAFSLISQERLLLEPEFTLKIIFHLVDNGLYFKFYREEKKNVYVKFFNKILERFLDAGKIFQSMRLIENDKACLGKIDASLIRRFLNSASRLRLFKEAYEVFSSGHVNLNEKTKIFAGLTAKAAQVVTLYRTNPENQTDFFKSFKSFQEAVNSIKNTEIDLSSKYFLYWSLIKVLLEQKKIFEAIEVAREVDLEGTVFSEFKEMKYLIYKEIINGIEEGFDEHKISEIYPRIDALFNMKITILARLKVLSLFPQESAIAQGALGGVVNFSDSLNVLDHDIGAQVLCALDRNENFANFLATEVKYASLLVDFYLDRGDWERPFHILMQLPQKLSLENLFIKIVEKFPESRDPITDSLLGKDFNPHIDFQSIMNKIENDLWPFKKRASYFILIRVLVDNNEIILAELVLAKLSPRYDSIPFFSLDKTLYKLAAQDVYKGCILARNWGKIREYSDREEYLSEDVMIAYMDLYKERVRQAQTIELDQINQKILFEILTKFSFKSEQSVKAYCDFCVFLVEENKLLFEGPLAFDLDKYPKVNDAIFKKFIDRSDYTSALKITSHLSISAYEAMCVVLERLLETCKDSQAELSQEITRIPTQYHPWINGFFSLRQEVKAGKTVEEAINLVSSYYQDIVLCLFSIYTGKEDVDQALEMTSLIKAKEPRESARIILFKDKV